MQNLLIRSIVIWCCFIPVAFINGYLRDESYTKVVGALAAHQISTVIASVAFIILVNFTLGDQVSNLTTKSLFAIGLLWVVMTMWFEFFFGYYIRQFTLQRLLLDYNIFKGYVWGVFLLIMLCSPFIVKMLLSRK